MSGYNKTKVKTYETRGSTVTVVLTDGTRIEGTPTKVSNVLRGLNVDLDSTAFYWSETKGLTRIHDMATAHIKNAVIKRYEEWLESLRKLSTDDFVNAITDGLENSSTEYRGPALKALVEEKIALGWNIFFMGSTVDALKDAQNLGIAAANTYQYDPNSKGLNETYSRTSNLVRGTRS